MQLLLITWQRRSQTLLVLCPNVRLVLQLMHRPLSLWLTEFLSLLMLLQLTSPRAHARTAQNSRCQGQ